MPKFEQRRVTVMLERPEFEELDGFCKRMGYKKTALIARLIADHLEQHAKKPNARDNVSRRQGKHRLRKVR